MANTTNPTPLPPNIMRYVIIGIIVVAVISIGYTSYVQIEQNQQGVKLRFGEYIETLPPGPHLVMPFGIETVKKVPTGNVFTISFSTGDTQRAFTSSTSQQRTTEEDFKNLVITGDLNLALINWVVVYKISNPFNYIFKVKNPDDTMKALAESVMRMIVGNENLVDVLTRNKMQLQNYIRKSLQELLDQYEIGIEITDVQFNRVLPPKEVEDSFLERNRARQEGEKKVNEAQKELQYKIEEAEGAKNRRHFEAQGRQEKMVSMTLGELEKYRRLWGVATTPPKEERERLEALRAEMEANDASEAEIERTIREEKAGYVANLINRFNRQQRERLYLEAMEEVYDKMDQKIFVGNENMVPLMNLGGLKPIQEALRENNQQTQQRTATNQDRKPEGGNQ